MQMKKLDLIHGAEAIAKVLGKNKRQIFWMLENGQIDGAVKTGRSWSVSFGRLAKQFGVDIDGGADDRAA